MDLNFYEKCIDQELSKIIKLGIEGLNFSYVSNLEKEVLSLKQREFTSKGQAYKFFEQLYKNSVYKLEEKLSEYDPLKIIESLMLYLSPLTKLTIISMNGEINFPLQVGRHLPNVWRELSVSVVNDKVLHTILKAYLGIKKRAIDIIVNINLIRINESSNNQVKSKLDTDSINDILADATTVCIYYDYFQKVSKENEENFSNKTVYIEQGKILYPNSVNFEQDLFINTVYKDYLYPVGEPELQKIYSLYWEELGFSPRKIINTFSALFFKNNLLSESILYKTKDELKCLVNLSNDTVNLKGLLVLLEKSICLEYRNQEKLSFIFDNNQRISTKGIIKIKDQYFLSFSTIVPYCYKLGNDMLNQDFLRKNGLSNQKISSYLANYYSEKWLHDIKNRMNKEGIWFEIQIGDFEKYFTIPPEKGITKEVDFILLDIHSKILYIGEYKNWQDVSFNFMNIFKEQQKIKKINQSHMNLLAILNLNLKKLFSMLKIHKVNGIEEVELKLINVFENRNISSNQNKDIKNFSRVEFEIYLQNNQSNFLKIKEK